MPIVASAWVLSLGMILAVSLIVFRLKGGGRCAVPACRAPTQPHHKSYSTPQNHPHSHTHQKRGFIRQKGSSVRIALSSGRYEDEGWR